MAKLNRRDALKASISGMFAVAILPFTNLVDEMRERCFLPKTIRLRVESIPVWWLNSQQKVNSRAWRGHPAGTVRIAKISIKNNKGMRGLDVKVTFACVENC